MSEDSDSSEEKKDKKKKETSTKIKIIKRSPDSEDDDFDTHVFMVRCDDDIMDEQLANDGMIDPYWTQPYPRFNLRLGTTTIAIYSNQMKM